MASYYNIDAILTDAQKVPCTFDIDVPGLGHLDENPGGDVRLPCLAPTFSQMPIDVSITPSSPSDQVANPRLPSPLALHPSGCTATRSLSRPALHPRPSPFDCSTRTQRVEGGS